MSELVAWQDAPRPCPDSDCVGVAEPEADGDLRYHACTQCGDEFGFERVVSQVRVDDGSCSLGVPAEVRRAVSAPMEKAQARQQPLLQISFGPSKEH